LVIPDLPIDIRALAADVREVEDDAVPLFAFADLFLGELCGVDGVEDGLVGGEEGRDVGGGLRVSDACEYGHFALSWNDLQCAQYCWWARCLLLLE